MMNVQLSTMYGEISKTKVNERFLDNELRSMAFNGIYDYLENCLDDLTLFTTKWDDYWIKVIFYVTNRKEVRIVEFYSNLNSYTKEFLKSEIIEAIENSIERKFIN